jgi:hypothetical protein
MTLGDAAALVGPLTLSYNVNDEAREYASYVSRPDNIRVRVRPVADGSFAGTYPPINGEGNLTTTYDPAARIFMILVDLSARVP